MWYTIASFYDTQWICAPNTVGTSLLHRSTFLALKHKAVIGLDVLPCLPVHQHADISSVTWIFYVTSIYSLKPASVWLFQCYLLSESLLCFKMLATVKTHGQMFPKEQCVPWLLACEQQKYKLFKTIHILWSGFSKLGCVPTKSSFLAEHKGTAAVWAKTTHPVAGVVLYILNFFFLTTQIHTGNSQATCRKGSFTCTRYGTSLHFWSYYFCMPGFLFGKLSEKLPVYKSGTFIRGKDAFLSPCFLSRVSLTLEDCINSDPIKWTRNIHHLSLFSL